MAFTVEHDDFSVDQCMEIELGERFGDCTELMGPILAAARIEPDLLEGDRGERAITVIFDFMDPVGSVGRPVFEIGKLGRNEGRQLHLAALAAVTVRYPLPGALGN